MKPQTPATDLERRKHVKLRLRNDLSIAPQKYEGRTYWVVKDPVALRYYRFKEQENFLLELMDGETTLDGAQKAFEKRFRPDRLTLEDLEQFGQQLLKAGLVHNESAQAGKLLFENFKKRKRQERMQKFTNILYVKIPIFDPEKLLVRMLPWVRFFFTGWFFIASIIFMLSALLLVMTHFDTFRERMPSFHEFFSLKTVFYLWAALGVVKVIHEFGHGLSCKGFGGEVHEMGFLLLCLSPAMYCNVSDAWTLPNKWKRIIISGAGIYVELMIASIATYVWWYTPGQPFVNYMALSLMFVCSVNTIVFNGNPLMRFDGYYVLSDLLEIPNLREKANRYLKRIFMNRCLGIEVQPEPYMAPWRRVLFVVFAIASYIYRWVVTFSILYMLSTFLGEKLRVLSQLLALFALGSMVGWPAWRGIKNYRKRGRLPDMKLLNTSITASVLGVVLIGFFFLPLPISRIRQTGLVQVRPGASVPVPLKENGILKGTFGVEDGDIVGEGAPLARFSNMQLENEVAAAKTAFLIQDNLVKEYRQQILATSDEQARKKMQAALLSAEKERETAVVRWKFKDKMARDLLTLTSPRAGTIMGVPKQDDIGKFWEKDKNGVFCTVGDPTKLRVLVPISPDDFDLLLTDLQDAYDRAEKNGKKNKQAISVEIRIQGRNLQYWKGIVTLNHLPKEAAKEIPLPLSNKAGGPLAVKPTSEAEHLIPQTQVHLVPIDLVIPENAVPPVPGNFAQVKIHLRHRTAAWWVWRTISKTFDLGLL